MRLTFWGAAQTVTGSMHMLELGGKRLLMDCGLYQGRRADAERINREFPAHPASIDAVLLSHAHIDHSGLLPRLHRDGFRGRIYCTRATLDLCAAMLRDSAHIQEKDAEWLNRRQRRGSADRLEPLYRSADVDAVMERFVGVEYGARFSPFDGVDVEYHDAGHMLGSATMTLTLREGGRSRKLGFTGDVGRPDSPILRDPAAMPDCDVLICESTYGGRVHEAAEEAKDHLQRVVADTVRRGGKVIVPAFAVGRTQEIVHRLDQLTNEGKLPSVPIFVDSPLAIDVTEVYRAHPECYDAALVEYMSRDPNPFGFARLTYVRDVEDSKRLNESRLPMVVIAASGMCEAGRVLHHLRNNVADPRNTVLIVGYCAPHTLGRRIVERQREVRIFGELHPLRAHVEVMNALSAHADEPELVRFVGHLDPKRLEKIFLVHGDPKAQLPLADALVAAGYTRADAPERGKSFEL
ncbi:MAG: MBL fold metallo-hydrolase RNA specificity domain-containing protein [Gemmatimonadales bacterium]